MDKLDDYGRHAGTYPSGPVMVDEADFDLTFAAWLKKRGIAPRELGPKES